MKCMFSNETLSLFLLNQWVIMEEVQRRSRNIDLYFNFEQNFH